MPTITSTKNPLIQAVKALQTRAAREESGLFLCEGEHMVAEALRYAKSSVTAVFVTESRQQAYAALLNASPKTHIYTVPDHVLDTLTQVKTPQGIAATVRLPARAALDSLGSRVVLLEAVQDPGNVGTILRTADAAGFDACVLTAGCADPFAPKTLRATMGSIFRMPIVTQSSAPQAAETLRAQGYAVLASVLDGDDFYTRAPLPQKVCLLIGNEGAGITPPLAAVATHRFRLPMRGGAESLNAAIAAAVFMYDIVNRG